MMFVIIIYLLIEIDWERWRNKFFEMIIDSRKEENNEKTKTNFMIWIDSAFFVNSNYVGFHRKKNSKKYFWNDLRMIENDLNKLKLTEKTKDNTFYIYTILL